MDSGYVQVTVLMPTNITLKCFGCGVQISPEKTVLQRVDITGNEDWMLDSNHDLTATFCPTCTYTEGLDEEVTEG